ncbi:MAG: hypothetical protein D6772_00065 [Bacteroidetes bacterium]|nr:MAG: hypothetical protein D6772_00065 [Bacteroidota bacterium]
MHLSPAPYFKLHPVTSFADLLPGIVLMLLLSSQLLYGQRVAPLLRKGEQAVEVADYYTAIHYFEQALATKPRPSTRFRLAEAARQFGAYELAERHYDYLRTYQQAAPFPTLDLGLGQCLLSQGKYEEAAASFARFLGNGQGNATQRAHAQAGLDNAQWAADQAPDSLWRVERLPRRINSPYAEFGAWRQGDSLYFTSYRYELRKDRYRPARKVAKVLFTSDEKRGRLLRRGFNADTVHTAHTAITPDGQSLYFTRCRFTEGARIRCQICVREKDRRQRWSNDFVVLPDPINMPHFTSTQPAIRWDTNDLRLYLIYMSDRPGSAGGFDLWQVPIPAKGEKWSLPSPLTAINTPQNEISPFFEPQSQTLYYSSERTPSYGGYDLFRQRYLGNEQWSKAENLGQPLNSSYDDTYPYWTADQTRVYFSSTRPGGTYLDPLTKNCCPDIFKASHYPPVPPITYADEDSLTVSLTPIPAPLPPTAKQPTTLEEFLPLALYFDNDQPDPRTRRATTKRTYADTYFQYIGREEDYYMAFTDEEDEQEALSQFFAEEVSKGYEDLERFSAILLQLLEEGQTVEIFLKGYTSPRAKGDYNLLLGKRRVSAVKNQFLQWRQGIFQPYIAHGQLIISEVSFGETRAAASVRDEKAGERLSIYSPEAARERRVEIVEVKRE